MTLAIIIVLFLFGCTTSDIATVQYLNQRIQVLETQMSDGGKERIPFRAGGPFRTEPKIEKPFIYMFIRNSNNSRTPVKLIQVGADVWVGPKGEYYDGLPAQQDLHKVYGF